SEDPSHLLGAIANYQRLDAAALAPDAQFARGAREAEATIATLLSRVHGPRRLLARKLLRRVRALAGAREAPKFHVVRVFAQGRAILARSAWRLPPKAASPRRTTSGSSRSPTRAARRLARTCASASPSAGRRPVATGERIVVDGSAGTVALEGPEEH